MKANVRIWTVVVVAAVVVVLGCGKESPLTPNTGQVIAPSDSVLTLLFDSPKTVTELEQLSLANHLNVLELRIQRPEYVAGFVLDGRDVKSAAIEFAKEHHKFLNLISSRDDTGMKSLRDAGKSELATFNEHTMLVHSIKVLATIDMVRGIPGLSIGTNPVSSNTTALPDGTDRGQLHQSPGSVNHPTQMWAPYGGTSTVNKSYSYQTFVFNDVSKFGSSWSAYEHETLITDKNFANQTGYWSSNLPNPYNDCGNFDSVDNFAVGSFTANQIRTFTTYFAYLGLVGQSSASSQVKIWAERATNLGWSCWSVKSDEHAGPLATHYTGGGMSWQF